MGYKYDNTLIFWNNQGKVKNLIKIRYTGPKQYLYIRDSFLSCALSIYASQRDKRGFLKT